MQPKINIYGSEGCWDDDITIKATGSRTDSKIYIAVRTDRHNTPLAGLTLTQHDALALIKDLTALIEINQL
jgi:hypothetical protein